MPDPVRYGDVERLLLDWLSSNVFPGFADDAFSDELPTDLVFTLPLVVVSRLGGPIDAVPGVDRPMVDVDVFAAGRDYTKQLARDAASAFRHQLTNVALSDGTTIVTAVRSIAGPAVRPWDNTDLRRFGFTYALTVQSRIAV